MKLRFGLAVILCTMLASGSSRALAQATLYWDTNGTTPGGTDDGSGIGDGNWDTVGTNTVWNSNPNGGGPGDFNGVAPVDAADYAKWRKENTNGASGYADWRTQFGQANGLGPQVWTDGNAAVFSAGTNVLDTIITITGTRTPSSLTIEEGHVHFTGVGISMGANPITVKSGAALSIPNQNVIAATAGQTMILDGGIFANTVVGVGSTLYTAGVATKILLTANGGTIYTPNGGNYTTDPINGAYSIMAYGNPPASTIECASGVSSCTLHKTGHGELRPFKNETYTALDVQSGLLRAASGGADSAFGAPTATVTVAGGAVENTTNGAAVGTTANLTSDTGGAGPSPATRNFVLSGVGATNDSMFVLNANWQILGNISGPGGLMLNGWERNDGGAVIGTQNELRLAGTNTYGGSTSIGFGTIVAQSGTAIPDTSQVMFSTRSLWGNGTQSTFNTAVLRVDASETIGSLVGGNATRGNVNLNGAAVTLTTGTDNANATYDGGISGAGSLSKTGSGLQTITGSTTQVIYTGQTFVTAGTLSFSNAVLADASNVLMTTGATLDLNYVGNDIIGKLFLDNVAQGPGEYGAIGSTAPIQVPYITGTGHLVVSTGGASNVSAVPEPGSLALVLAGLALVSLRRRER